MTLVEVLLAIAILAIVGVAFLMALGGGLMGTIVADERTVAESLARSQLEAIKTAQYDATGDYELINRPPGYDISISIGSVNTGLQKITVTVTIERTQKKLQVETYKAR